MKNKKLILLLALLIMLTSVNLRVEASGLNLNQANYLKSLGLFVGTDKGFELEKSATRAESAAMLVRLLGAEKESNTKDYKHPFTDVFEWADGYIGYMYQNGLAAGVSKDKFNASERVDGKAYATFVLRALGYNDSQGDFDWEDGLEFAHEIGVLDDEELVSIKSKSFTRNDMVLLSYNALNTKLKDRDISLLDSLVEKGAINTEQDEKDEPIETGLKIISHKNKDKISGPTYFQVSGKKNYPEGSYVRYVLGDKGDSKGFVIAKGNDIEAKYEYTPKLKDRGDKVLSVKVFDKQGIHIDGDQIELSIDLVPKLTLLGVENGEKIKDKPSLRTQANFLPLYVKYEIKEIDSSDQSKGTVLEDVLLPVRDPEESFQWDPKTRRNGLYSIRAIAYDQARNPYYSETKMVELDREKIIKLSGVKEGMTIDSEVYLVADRNFDVSETEYVMRDINTGKESTIAKMPYGGYMWSPKPEDIGTKEIFVRVMSKNIKYESDPIKVHIKEIQARLSLEGVGPEQVVNKTIILGVKSNVDVDNIKYFITNMSTGQRRELTKGADNKASYTPLESDKTYMQLEAQATYKGKTISSEKIKFKIHHGELHGPKPIIEKDKFKDFASKMAVDSYRETGMSAAVQTAQAILETGWGQSVPVDKYTGKKSNNLFGIKKKGTEESVVSNTWEVYNGQKYHIDAEFRAYKDPGDSWKDHKTFLLERERYSKFKEVMYDYTKGAWELKRAGYATDPEYPIKLINIINSYKLDELDKVDL